MACYGYAISEEDVYQTEVTARALRKVDRPGSKAENSRLMAITKGVKERQG